MNVEWVPIDEVKPDPRNPNKHPKEQIDRLVKLIKHHGWRWPIIVSKQDGMIKAGHGRLLAAQQMNLKEVPISYQDFASDEDAYAFLVSDNGIGAWSELDLAAINTDVGMLGPDFDIELLGLKDFTIEVADKASSSELGDNPKTKKLSERFLVPPFSVLDARQGYWQERKKEWLSMGIKSELGRGEERRGEERSLTWNIATDGSQTR